MHFNQESKNVEYGQLWNEMMEQKQFEVITGDIVIGPQGVRP